MILSCTGHRPKDIGGEYDMKGPISTYIREELRKAILDRKPDKLMSGGALGCDTLFALLGIEMNIPVIMAVPFIGQEKIWPQASKSLYYNMLENPLVETKVVFEGGYSSWKLLGRNKFMVDNSDELAAIWNGNEHGGTYHCYSYALEKHKIIHRIDPRKALNV